MLLANSRLRFPNNQIRLIKTGDNSGPLNINNSFKTERLTLVMRKGDETGSAAGLESQKTHCAPHKLLNFMILIGPNSRPFHDRKINGLNI